MKEKYLFFVFLSLVSINSCSVKERTIDQDPNVLIIFPDQLRRYSSGYWQEEPFRSHVIGRSDPVFTPRIDDLARNGVVFTNAISNFPLCSPYRGMMLTGQYPEQNGIWGNCRTGRSHELKDDVKTITDLFFEAGYNTAYFGKCHWKKTEPLFDEQGSYKGSTEAPGGHLINTYDTYVPPGPSRHSIEYFYQALKDTHFDPLIYSSDPIVIDGKKDGELHRVQAFSAMNEAEIIVKYLQNTHQQRNIDKPFCMIWSLNPPHNPWDNANTDMEMLYAHYDTNKFERIEDLVVRENSDPKVAHYARNYFANVSSVDQCIGIVLEELKKQGLLDNTIVILTSDHGEMLGSHGKTGKNVLETESIAIPLVVHYPAKLTAGINTSIFDAIDLLPTLLGLAGHSDIISEDIQGVDFSKEIFDPEQAAIQEDAALLMVQSHRGVYNKAYTLVVKENPADSSLADIYLYDNSKDPYQKTRLKEEEKPEVVSELLVILGQKLKGANDPWYSERKYKDYIVYPE